jgi:hypothetical protein
VTFFTKITVKCYPALAANNDPVSQYDISPGTSGQTALGHNSKGWHPLGIDIFSTTISPWHIADFPPM